MAVANVHIVEFFGGGATANPPIATSGAEQDDVSNLNLVSTLGTEQSSSAYPVTAGLFSFSKWVCYEMHALNDSNKIDNFQAWMTTASGDPIGVLYWTNLHTTLTNTTATYPAPPTATWIQTEGSVTTAYAMPTADPTAENIGVNESGATGLDSDTPFAAGNLSDFIVIQLETSSSTPPGNLPQKTFHFQYDEQ